MISTRRKQAPRLSLDGLLDRIINNPTNFDEDVFGDLTSDKPRSSKPPKGYTELIELNEWINLKGRRPDLESSENKESQLARRMNSYALNAKHLESLKPFDKYGLIDTECYIKPKPIEYENHTSLGLSNIEGLSVNAQDGFAVNHAEKAISINRLDIDSQATPLTSPTDIGGAAKAILRMRAAKANELNDVYDEHSLVDAPAEVRSDVIVNANGVDATTPAEHGLPLPINNYYPTSQQQEFALTAKVDLVKINESAEIKKVTVTAKAPLIIDPQDISKFLTPAVIYTPNLSYFNIYYNPPASALSPFDITYVSKYSAFSFDADSSEQKAMPADESDEILQVFSQVPLQDYVPDSYQDNDDSYFYAPVQTPDKVVAETLITSINASNVYWSIDGDYDATIVNSDSITGLTQRHNPEPPMTATQRACCLITRNSQPASAITPKLHSSTTSTKPAEPNEKYLPKTNLTLDLDFINSPSTTETPNTSGALPTTNILDNSNAKTRIGLNSGLDANSARDIGCAVNRTPQLKTTEKLDVGNTEYQEEVIATSIDYFLEDAVIAGMKAAQSKSTTEIKVFNSLDDILDNDSSFLEDLSAAEDKYFDMTDQFGVNRSSRASPDEVGRQTPCYDFYKHESYFKILHSRLESGDLKTIKYTAVNLKEGDAFILDGMVGFIYNIGEERTGYNGHSDPRLRLIFDNKTESNILLSTLSKRLYTDPNGMRIIPSADDFSDFQTPNSEERTRVGQIYVVRSLSDNPIVKNMPNLYKIGFTRSTAEDRIKNAIRDTAFLQSPVDIILKVDFFDRNPSRIEAYIHKFLTSQQVIIELTGRNGGSYRPKEWFDIELNEIKKIISHIVDGTIINYRMDNTTNRLVAK